MNKICIVTDNASDLSAALLAEHNIIVVPLDIRFSDLPAESLRDIKPQEFWKLARKSSVLPKTTAPAPGAFGAVFARAAEDGCAGCVCITVSSALSSTYQAACMAAHLLDGQFPVAVVDSRTITLAEGMLVLEAAELVESGAGLADVVTHVESAVGRTCLYGALGTLDWLHRGGRIGGAQTFLGSVLSIKPIITMNDRGVVEAASRQRTRRHSLEYLVNRVAQALPLKRLAVGHADAADIDVLLDMLAPVYPRDKTLVGYIGPVIGTHTGPGAIGVGLMRP
jgi:DegV family protein with EDD domain